MSVSIRFRKDPELTHINLRKEGQEGAEEIAVDLKLCGLAEIGREGSVIQKLLGCEPEQALAFWARPTAVEVAPDPQDEGPEVSFHGLSKITCWAEYQERHTVNIAGLEFRPKKIKKFSFTPRPGYLLDLEFQVSITGIENRELQILTEYLREQVPCEVDADPDLFDEQ